MNNGIGQSVIKIPAIILFFNISVSPSFANDVDLVIDDRSGLSKDIELTDVEEYVNKSPELPINDVEKTEGMTKEEAKQYLQENPDEFEKVLSLFLINPNAPALEELLPLYEKYPNHDRSVIDWGQAIIAASENRLDDSIRLYRKLNSALPEVALIRLQLAIVLYRDRQFEAAESEFEKLRAEKLSEEHVLAIDNYLDAIKRQNDWSFGLNLSYLDDKNITNAPPVGTKLGSRWTYTSQHESGKGVGYSISADKKWVFDNKFFAALDAGSYGKYYWDNHKYNDISGNLGLGLGYQDAKKELQIGPQFSKRWYAGGNSNNGELKSYSQSLGVRFSASYWLNNKLRLQNFTKYSETDYEGRYKRNDSSDFYYSNSLVYFANQNRYMYGGVDFSNRDSVTKSESNDRRGIRLGWGQAWPLGMSSRLNAGYARRDYKAPDFFGIKRKNDEFTAGLSLWNRGVHFLGLTPRINYSYTKVSSNESFEEYDKHNVSAELTKTF